ncbi:hypothetical protein [uncultured Comamonas sp.]|uniref:hypothetical protein n=2 Tax=Comamonas TaxID=283 RepID=UPI00261C85B6|nr:hypothetical protein [uncultured Comamonas sp.]
MPPLHKPARPMPSGWQRAWRHVNAPPKPPVGSPCNGCGLCCLAEPCPLGMLYSRRTTGPCVKLRWDDGAGRYVCGVLQDAERAVQRCSNGLTRGWRALVRRWIAASMGCDADGIAEVDASARSPRA